MTRTELEPSRTVEPDYGGIGMVSLVLPVFNEASTIDEVVVRAARAFAAMPYPYEIIVVDDGSTDGTWARVRALHEGMGVRAVRFKRNVGQHPAMHAGIVRARGDVVVTMDADLQNDPGDIPRLMAAIAAGSDVASGRRVARASGDARSRTIPSRIVNGMLRRFTGVDIADFGCGFNAYRREAMMPVIGAIGKQKFTKALVLSTGASVTEVDLGHAARRDRSRYSPLRLTRLALHVLAGFWPQPIQWAGVAIGLTCSLLAIAVAAWGVVHWVARDDFPGPLFLAGLVLGVLGVQGFILALVGEHLGRIQRDVEGRPLYTVEQELG